MQTAPASQSFARHRALVGRAEALEDARCRLRRRVLDAEEVLDPERHAAEVGRVALLQPRRGEARLVARRSGVRAETALSAAAAFGRGEAGLGQLDRADRRPRAGPSRASAMVRDGERAHSTTFGTVKKPARASGAFSSTLVGMPPSVTTSSRQVSAIGVTEVIGSTPVDVDLVQLLHEAEDAGELRRQRLEVGLRHLDAREVRHPARGILVDRHSWFPESGQGAALACPSRTGKGARRPCGAARERPPRQALTGLAAMPSHGRPARETRVKAIDIA